MTERSVPAGWTIALLRDIASVNPTQPDFEISDDEAVTFVGMASVEAGTARMDTSTSRYWANVKRGYTRFQNGDVLFAKITPCMENGKVAVATRLQNGVGAGSTEFHVLRPYAIDSKLLAYFLLRAEVRSAARARMTGSAGQLRVPADFWDDFVVPTPPEHEQRRIIEAIEDYASRLEDAEEELNSAYTKLDRFRASILNAAIFGRLVPTEAQRAREEGREYEPADVLLAKILRGRQQRWQESELAKMTVAGRGTRDDTWKKRYQEPVAPDTSSSPDLPEGWCWASVDMVGDVLLGRQRAPQYLLGVAARPYLRVANVKDDRLDLSDIETMDFVGNHFNKYRLEADDVLVSEGQSPELVGQSAIYRGGVEGLCFQKTLHRFRPVAGGPSAEYAQLVFRSHVRQGVFRTVASITTNIAHLTLEKFKSAPFPLPPSHEQKRIEVEAARLLSIADEVEAETNLQARHIAALRQSILRWAFEGKLVDQDPNDEPASELIARIRAERTAREPQRRAPRAPRSAEPSLVRRRRRETPPR
jgi:type I restriction enzyme S subunit